MKKNLLIILSLTIVIVFSGCNPLNKMMENAGDINYTVNPEVLEMHGGEVAVNITGNFPTKYFHRKVEATVTPVLVYEGGEKALTPVRLQGERVEGNAHVITYEPGGRFTYNDKFDFIDAMRVSQLELRVTAKTSKKEVDFDPVVIAEGVIATPSLVQNYAKTAQAQDRFVKDNPASKQAAIFFEKDRWNIRPTELREDDINEFRKFVEKAKEDERKEFRGFNIRAYASPEGEYQLNERVSSGRKGSAKTFVNREFRNIEEFKKEDFINTQVTVEDWDGFRRAVQASDLDDKDLILRVLQMHSDPVEREKEIRNMTATFAELEEYIHPRLRRSELELNIMLIGNTDEEINHLFDSLPEELTVEEILYLGKISDNINRKLEVYTKCTELFPNEWRGFNNLGYIQYQMEDYEAAKVSFEKANSLNSNSTVFNNLGVIALLEGDIETAKQMFTSATGVSQASYGQGILSIKEADYSTAANYMSNFCSFNAGLAKLLAGKTDEALKAIECDDKDNAMNYYLKAVIGARNNNSDAVFNNLRTALTKDGSLKETAKTDMEFRNYFDNNTFQSIVN